MSTPVIFRKWPESEGGGIIALFPTEVGDQDPANCMSYEHIGQHGSAWPEGVMKRTTYATPAEYADLKRELEDVGYEDIQVVTKLSPTYLAERMKTLHQYLNPKSKLGKKVTRQIKKDKKSAPASLRGMR